MLISRRAVVLTVGGLSDVAECCQQKHHYQDMPPALRRQMGALPGPFLHYFTKRFPSLVVHVHTVISDSPLLRGEAMFASYFRPVGDND